MKRLFFPVIAVTLLVSSCKKTEETNNPTEDFNTLKQTVLTNFTNNIAVASYKDLDEASVTLYSKIEKLNTDASEANLSGAIYAWKDMRSVWEQSEGFLFGPVEDNDYDPNMDTWPTDKVQIDSLLSSSNALEVGDIENVALSLRGYHPIEYIIFGDHGDRKAIDITSREKKYMMSLAADLKNTCHALYTSWTQTPTYFAQEILTAGNGSKKYAKKQEVFLAMLGGMVDICEEVGEGKMKEPFDTKDPSIVESPYSGNSLIDFKNNIIGLQNVYMGKYKTDGKGINDLVAQKNISLDNKIQNELNAAIKSFDNITVTYEHAIIDQRTQVKATMDALAELKETLDTELRAFIMTNITD